jgi:glucokinase
VGGALWLGGALYAGPGGAAGEIGHMPGFGDRPCTCGAAGHLETLASGLSISRLHLERSGALLTALEVAGAAVAGDQPAREIFDEVGRALARAVLVGTALLDIDTVVIGGGVSNAWKLFQPALFEQLRVEPPVRGAAPSIVLAELGALAVATGAAIRSHQPLGV